MWCVVIVRCLSIVGTTIGGTSCRGDVDTRRLGEDRGYQTGLPGEVAPYLHLHDDGHNLVQAMT